MSIEIRLEKAFDGECIWVRYGEVDKFNIIIDSGPAKFLNNFNALIEKIKLIGERVGLLILTHVHDDHIGGFRKYISCLDCDIIDKVWLNGDAESYYKDQVHSVKNIGGLVSCIRSKDINLITPVVGGKVEEFKGASIKILTPTYEDMINVAVEIEQASIHSKKSIDLRDIDDIKDDDTYESDSSIENKASISFILSYKDKNIAFLGDSHAECIIEAIDKFWNGEQIHLVKLPHHGSKKNVSLELLEKLNCDKYVICHQNQVYKDTLARIMKFNDTANIYCNYNWWLNSDFFTEKDLEKYIDTKKLNIEEKNEIFI